MLEGIYFANVLLYYQINSYPLRMSICASAKRRTLSKKNDVIWDEEYYFGRGSNQKGI